MPIIPIFKTTYSITSILTLEKPAKVKDGGADSVVDIAVKNNLKQVYLLEDSFIGFKKAHELFSEHDIQLIFGIRFNICNDRKEEDKKSSAHKIAIFAKNDAGCKELMKLYSAAFTESQGYLDCETLKDRWSDNLFLAVPFYDSFIHKNAFYFCSCLPDFSFTTPTIFWEDNELPFDELLREKTFAFAAEKKWPAQEIQTIYYKERQDFEAWQVYKMATHRQPGRQQTLEKPQIDHCSSNGFCWEAYEEKRKQIA